MFLNIRRTNRRSIDLDTLFEIPNAQQRFQEFFRIDICPRLFLSAFSSGRTGGQLGLGSFGGIDRCLQRQLSGVEDVDTSDLPL